MEFPTEDFINRRITYRFSGAELHLDLSLGLFSSAGVDTGSMLLLKTLAKEAPVASSSAILDVGCGVGTLGLALAKKLPGSLVTMVDRDEMAVVFTKHNAALNGIENIRADSRLMLEGPHETHYDLILTNFPAKAGEPVLEDFINRSLSYLNPGGRTAIVIVHTLADRCREIIESSGAEILHTDSSKQHTVFHYGGSNNAPLPDGSNQISPYIRHTGTFKFKKTRYTLDTVWNISDFDTLSWRLKLIGEMLDREPRSGCMAFWAPGQGHLPLAVAARRAAEPARLILAGRDRLELLIGKHNLKDIMSSADIEIRSIVDPSLLNRFVDAGSLDLLVTDLSPVPKSDWTGPLRDCAKGLLKSGGEWALVGRSADIASLLKVSGGWTPLHDKRNKGWRAMILRKN
jgi:16S rRNA G1207 methylase RsmC